MTYNGPHHLLHPLGIKGWTRELVEFVVRSECRYFSIQFSQDPDTREVSWLRIDALGDGMVWYVGQGVRYTGGL
jgi:hypothetical protein